jgi:prevent-host-death family protein
MRKTKVSELKTRLSSYLADVRGGESIVVCDRNTPIARLVPTEDGDGFQVREPTRPLDDLRRLKAIRPKGRVDVEGLLHEDRDQR